MSEALDRLHERASRHACIHSMFVEGCLGCAYGDIYRCQKAYEAAEATIEFGLGKDMLRYVDALTEVFNVLGPHGAPDGCENTCRGCRYEMDEAVRVVRKALDITEETASQPGLDPGQPA